MLKYSYKFWDKNISFIKIQIMANLSKLFASRSPSPIRIAQIELQKRTDGVKDINLAIGNVSLPMHPKMQKRLFTLSEDKSPFNDGVVKYTPSAGTPEARQAMLRVIEASGFDSDGLYSQITDGGSQSMELAIVGTCGAWEEKGDSERRPLLIIDPSYSNYISFAERVGIEVVGISSEQNGDGSYSAPSMDIVEEAIDKHNPGALLIIPYNNPTGQFYTQEEIDAFAELSSEKDIWLISDEAYRELRYSEDEPISSIWNVDLEKYPKASGRRLSIESASKVWNACGLRIGGIVTDNERFHAKSVAEYTANLCANAIGQHIYSAINEMSDDELNNWFEKQRDYYSSLSVKFAKHLKAEIPDIKISTPGASLYSIVDVGDMVDDDFSALDFVMYCAQEGSVDYGGAKYTVLLAPLTGFFTKSGKATTQMRLAYVERASEMEKVPAILKQLLEDYMASS
jgi:aspartate aminotransferase